MKRYILLVLMLYPLTINAQWTQMTNIPNTGYTALGIAQAGSHRYLFTDHGVYTLNDQNIATKEIFSNPVATFLTREDTLILFSDYVYFLIHEGDSIRAEKSQYPAWNPELAIDLDSVLIFGGQGGVRVHWDMEGIHRQYVSGLPNNGTGFDVRCYALSNDTLFAAQGKAIYYCKLGEYQWQELPLDLPLDVRGKSIRLFRIRGQEMIVAINHAFSSPDSSKHDCMLYYSEDRGKHFEPWSPELPISTTGFVEVDSTYYWAVSGSGILKRSYADPSWQPLNAGLKSLSVNFLSEVDGELYCGTSGQEGYWLNDTIWQPIKLLVPQFHVQNMISGDGDLYVSTNDSIFRVIDGQRWENITPSDCPEKTWTHLIKRPDQLIVSGFDDGNIPNNWELFFLKNEGEWSRRATPFTADSSGHIYHKWLLSDGSRLHIHNGRGYYSDTQGWTWNTSFIQMWPPEYLAIASHMVYGCSQGYLGRFITSPKKWESLPNLTQSLENMGFEVNDPRNAIDLFFACQDKLFFHYKDHSPDRQHGFFRSDDLGESWKQINSGLEEVIQNKFRFYSYTTTGSTIVLTTTIGCFVSTDMGDSWTTLTAPINNSKVAILNDTLYYSTYNAAHGQKAGIWKYPLNQVVLSTKHHLIQTIDYSIYPNPASESFRINTNHSGEDRILSLISLDGKVLIRQKFVSDESITIKSYPEGIYFVEIFDGHQRQIKKLIIQRPDRL